MQLLVYLDEDDQREPFVEKFGLNPDELAAPMIYMVDAQGMPITSTLGNPPGEALAGVLKQGLNPVAAP